MFVRAFVRTYVYAETTTVNVAPSKSRCCNVMYVLFLWLKALYATGLSHIAEMIMKKRMIMTTMMTIIVVYLDFVVIWV